LIPHSRPTVSEDDAQAVAQVIREGQLAQGPEIAAFEAEVAERVGVPAAEFLARRRTIAADYRRRLAGLACRLLADVGTRHVYHRFVVEVEAPLRRSWKRSARAA
jgi:dTDP-4-amino-4,6-dideoxygalactose transaminase